MWPELVSEWKLEPHEQQYIDEQQGLSCVSCGSNLRAITLAFAILTAFRSSGTLLEWADASSLTLLEINEAYTLTPIFQKIHGHILARYPEVDLHSLPYPDSSFDLIVHSDTLEHVADPVQALSECRRVLKCSGYLAYTVPVIVGRMSRSRLGMPASYHGSPDEKRPDHLVHTEFGADFWTYPMGVGFGHLELVTLCYPSSVALLASVGPTQSQRFSF